MKNNYNTEDVLVVSGVILDIVQFITLYKREFLIKYNNDQIIKLYCLEKNWDTKILDYDYVECQYYVRNDLHYCVKIKLINHFISKNKIINKQNRNELNIITKASKFNSINDLNTVIKILKKNNIPILSIADINTLRNVSNVIKLAKKHKLKPIIGLQITIIDDIKSSVNLLNDNNNTNLLNHKIKDVFFIVLDLETNGINPYNSEIIEIGLVIIKNLEIVNSYQWFINYKKINLKQSIIDLTKITLLLLKKNGKSPKLVAKELWKIINNNNAILVSHSEFDIGFLNIFLKKYLNKELINFHIDTWILSQKVFMNKTNKFSVENLCKFLDINIEGQLHRAIDDAKNTGKIFLKIIDFMNPIYLKDLELKKIFYQSFSYNATLVCKNFLSLEKLYEILSLANCKYFKYCPRIPKSIIQQYKKYFIIISSNINGEILNNFKKGTLEIFFKNKINKNFYDYYEILPEDAQLYLLNKHWYLLQNKNGNQYIEETIFEDKDLTIYYNILFNNKCKLLASCGFRFLFKEDYITFDILHSYRKHFDNIQGNSKLYFRNNEVFANSFPMLKSKFPKKYFDNTLFNNSQKIVDNISVIELMNTNFFLINSEQEINDFKKKIILLAKKNFGKNYLNPIIFNRIQKELSIICQKGFVKFFNLGEKLFLFANEHNQIIGSRGSVGSSFVAYLLGITEVNSLPPYYFCEYCDIIEFVNLNKIQVKNGFDLIKKKCLRCSRLFIQNGHNLQCEMFFGKDGNRIPDIDINVSPNFQKLCHNFFLDTNYKFQITKDLKDLKIVKSSTCLKIREKNALFFIDKFISKNNHLTKCQFLISIFLLKNCIVSQGQHPGGIIFIPKEYNVFKYSPIVKNNVNFLTELEWHDIDNVLLKLDILSHEGPAILKFLLQKTNIKLKDIKFNDKKVLKIFSSCEKFFIKKNDNIKLYTEYIYYLNIFKKHIRVSTLGIPEFGTKFSRNVLYKIKPTTFEHLVQISGLTHGKNIWVNNASFLISKNIKNINEILCNRDDILKMLLHHNIDFNLAFEITSFIKKGKSYTDISQWLKYKSILEQHNIDKYMISHLQKISYLFPKSHAIAYVMTAFRIAYFKIYFPVLFYISYLNKKIEFIEYEFFNLNYEGLLNKIQYYQQERYNNKNKYFKYTQFKNILEIFLEMKLKQINFIGIDFYKSDLKQFIIEDGQIRIPLYCIKGLGLKNLLKIGKIRKKISKNINDYRDFKRKTNLNYCIIDLLIKYNIIKLQKTYQNKFLFYEKYKEDK